MNQRKNEITNALCGFNKKQLVELVENQFVSNELFDRIMKKATIVTANEVEINRISSQIFENVNQSMIENDCETSDTKLERLTDLLKTHQIMPPKSHLYIRE